MFTFTLRWSFSKLWWKKRPGADEAVENSFHCASLGSLQAREERQEDMETARGVGTVGYEEKRIQPLELVS